MDWTWHEGTWRDLNLTNLGLISIESIGCPWAWNIHRHLNYNRLFWDIYNNGMKTPLLVRPWNYPFLGDHLIGCTSTGKRLDSSPAPSYTKDPIYELILGNMRYCAAYTQSYKLVSALLLPEEEFSWQVNDLWEKYHPLFEGNWYQNPEQQMPSKYTIGFD